MKKYLLPLSVLLLMLSLSSCLVSKKKFDEQVALTNKYLAEKNDCNDKLIQANGTIDDLNRQIGNLNAEIQKLKDSNASLEEKNRKLGQLKNESDAICEKVKEQLEQITNSSAAEKDKLMKQLAEKEKELMAKAAELDKLGRELNERDAKVRELESLIARKDSAVQALKKKIVDALKGFNAGDLTVYENVELPLTYRGMPSSERKTRVLQALERVGMSHRMKHYPSQLSGGQQQRVAVARALGGDPSILLADEPTGNLDSANGEQVMELLKDLHKTGSTICMVTHDERYSKHAERTIHLFDGKVVNENSGSN